MTGTDARGPRPGYASSRGLASARLSVLDRSLVRAGRAPGEAVRGTVAFAREIEALGYHRFWVSEHHGVPGVAGSAPTVLAAAVAGATSRIRVGTAGVMLPNHQPLVVAEQFGVLEALHPGRVDMGLGRSVGFTAEVRRALRTDRAAAEEFEPAVVELLGYFDGVHPVPALPAEGAQVPAFVLATGAGAQIAGRLGLPVVVGGPDREAVLAAVERYRAAFVPSSRAAEPFVVVAVNAAVGATEREAALLQVPEAWAMTESRVRGVFPPLLPPAQVLEQPRGERAERYFRQARSGQVHGTAEQVAEELDALVRAAGADELMLTLNTHDPADRLDSYRRLAALTTPLATPSSTRS
ncbi:MsnO8 family LLM class oxidoreductase [Streptomyces sp. XM4193]|uniref:MsnO8 family LLM class oxidoreductase n=1 Tax=Streptomyces sp. XM4193 TaxID=2929782 RepID=UPI001FF82B89|nr:MsnO8 family LLM class oxidoreductase [Streptomyces sp. XM4193]MCK1798127.1 MsnO8 family LLM class oxidoreductase [Streptomyces sp. XM4193]